MLARGRLSEGSCNDGRRGSPAGIGLRLRGPARPSGWWRLDSLLDRELRGGSGARHGRLRTQATAQDRLPGRTRRASSVVACLGCWRATGGGCSSPVSGGEPASVV